MYPRWIKFKELEKKSHINHVSYMLVMRYVAIKIMFSRLFNEIAKHHIITFGKNVEHIIVSKVSLMYRK